MMAFQLAKAFAEFKVRGLRSLRSLAMLPGTGIVNKSGSVRNRLERRRSRASDRTNGGNSSKLPTIIRGINGEAPRRRFKFGQQTTDALNQRAALRNDRDARNASRKVSKAIADPREVVQPRDTGGRINGFRG